MKLYLSPSNQPANKYVVGNTTEKIEMEAVAARVKALLDRDYSCDTVMATLSMGISANERPQEAKNSGCDFYIAIHSNAAGGKPPCTAAGAVAFYHPNSAKSKAIAEAVVKELNAVCPHKSNRASQVASGMTQFEGSGYGEIRSPMQKGVQPVLIEVNFHDNTTTAQWIIDSKDAIAAAVVKAITAALSIAKKSGAAATPAPTPTPAAPTGDVDKTIWDFLIAKGLNAFGAAGLMGNLFAESALNPRNLQNSYENKLSYTDATYTAAVDNGTYSNFVRDSAGYGLAQWTFWSRKQALLDFVKAAGASIGDLSAQLNFLWKELQGYAGIVTALKSATSILQASNLILTQYEKPADMGAAVQAKRAEYGQTYYNKFAGKGATVAPPTAPVTPTTPATPPAYKVGDIVQFNGGSVYKSSNAATAATAKDASRCKVTQLSSGAKYPLHLVSEDNGGVWGWVAAADVGAGAQNAVPYTVKIARGTSYRKGPAESSAVAGTIKDGGVYTIVEEQGGFGKLKSGAGWVSLGATVKI
ncbi:MAG: phage tail-type lysozyme domain-containing protein [Oscillospiraceae bacterium]|jgi:hypothetical protein|nr:phage tail-type lysozyme domain-containing protein [Oscillospiraceae bacterium]